MKNNLNYDSIKDLLLEELSENFSTAGVKLEEAMDNIDLLRDGIIDSMEFIELIEILEGKYHLSIDLSKMTETNISEFDVFIKEILLQNNQ